ncbi:meiosis-specific protein ASY2-like [Raphanus sativus]|uniref:Meiosis-specific protein ASY2-like n=1 Tax=Raphanus sativus TaxID=3726 RepID=A0A6J0LH08_RAPSA|nr:meiosis-specific protein ASY2-like [Raphanus sativus]
MDSSSSSSASTFFILQTSPIRSYIMASQSKPGPLTPAEYDALMELRGVPYEAVIDYPNSDAPGSVRPRYCGAYMCFFRDGLMSFPIPSFFLEILAELQLSFTQVTPTFWHYVLATFIRATEEGLEFGLAELKQLYTLKRSSGVTGEFLLSPRLGRSVITDIPGKDFYWTDKFFVFKIDPVTVGDFDFSRIPMKWNENAELFGTSKSTPELRGLISALRRGKCSWDSFTLERVRAAYALPPGVNHVVLVALAEPIRPRKDQKDKGVKRKDPPAEPSDANSDSAPSKRAHETPDKRVTRASSEIQSPIFRATPLYVVRPGRDVPPDSRASGEVDVEEVAPKVQRRRLIPDEESSKGFNVSSSEPLMQDPGEGTSKPVNLPADCRSGSPLAFSYDVDAPILDDPERLAAIWRKLRSSTCALPPLEQMRGRDAYVQMAIANAKAMEASNEYAALMEERLANFPSQEEVAGHLNLIQKLRSKLSASHASEQERAKQVVDLKVLLTAKATEKVTLEEEKIMLEKEKVVLEKEKVAMEADLESLKAKFRRDAELRERVARREMLAACWLVAKGYDAALDKARETIRRRRAESAAEMRLQEVRAKIEALAEYLEGGFELEEELDILKDVEISREIEYSLAAVSDDSLRGLDLPQVYEDSVNLGG